MIRSKTISVSTPSTPGRLRSVSIRKKLSWSGLFRTNDFRTFREIIREIHRDRAPSYKPPLEGMYI